MTLSEGTLEIITTLVAVVVTSALTAIAAWFKSRKDAKATRLRLQAIGTPRQEFKDNKHLKEIVFANPHEETYRSINYLMTEVGAQRVIVMAAREDVASVLYEIYQGDMEPISRTFTNQKLDAPYVEVLRRLREQGELTLNTADMDDGMLKDRYSVDGVGWARKAKIMKVDGTLYYLAATFNGGSKVSGPEDPKLKDTFRIITNRLRINLSALFEHNTKRSSSSS